MHTVTADTMHPFSPLSLSSSTSSSRPLYLEVGFKEQNTQQRIKIDYLTHTSPQAAFKEAERKMILARLLSIIFDRSWRSSWMTKESKSCTHLQKRPVTSGPVFEGRAGAAIHLDFSKDFNTDFHNIILSKIEHYSLDGWTTTWIKLVGSLVSGSQD